MSSPAEHVGKRFRREKSLESFGDVDGYADTNISTNGSNRDGDKAITRPTTEAEYVKKNLKRQRLVTAQLNELLKQETKQLQKLQSKQTRNNQVPLLEWFSKQSKVELLAMVQIGSILFNLNNSFKRSDVEVINAGHISKRQLAHYVVSRFTRGELAQLKQENQRLVLGEKQRQENAIYQQRRLFDIFKQWLLQAGDGKIFECSYSSVSSLYSFQYWYSEFEVIAENQSSFLSTRFLLRYDPKHNLWFECLASLEDQSQAHQVHINYSQCLYDCLSTTVMISSSSLSSGLPILQAKWIPNEDNLHLERAVSPNNIKLRAALLAETAISMKLLRFCNDCSRRMILEFEIVDPVVVDINCNLNAG